MTSYTQLPASDGALGFGAAAPAAYTPAFQAFIDDNELSAEVAADLLSVLPSTRVVLLLDDSGSMKTRVLPPGGSAVASAGPVVTRWSELEKLTATIVEMVNSVTGGGLDAHFLNRPSVRDARSRAQLAPAFAAPPSGGTPLLSRISALASMYASDLASSRVLLLVITDGEPSDGSPDDLFLCLQRVLRTHSPRLFVSFAECNDNEEEMAYLDGWDRRLPNFDNTDDYGMEAMRVKAALASKGQRVRFTYADYAVKIMLGAILRKYFNLDQTSGMNDCCCTIM